MLKVMVNSPNDSSYLRKKQQWGLKVRNNEIQLFSTRTYFWSYKKYSEQMCKEWPCRVNSQIHMSTRYFDFFDVLLLI